MTNEKAEDQAHVRAALSKYVNARAIAALISWCQNPSTPELTPVLMDLSDLDLLYILAGQDSSKGAKRLAWVELGSRHCGYDFNIQPSYTEDGGLKLAIQAEALSVNDHPASEIDQNDDW